jgi:hypothetical protein
MPVSSVRWTSTVTSYAEGDVGQHELGAPEHGEPPVGDGAPGEVDEAAALATLHRWAEEIAAVGAYLGDPLRLIRVTWDETGRVAADLQPDMDVVVRPARAAGEVMAADDQAHPSSIGSRGEGRASPRRQRRVTAALPVKRASLVNSMATAAPAAGVVSRV